MVIAVFTTPALNSWEERLIYETHLTLAPLTFHTTASHAQTPLTLAPLTLAPLTSVICIHSPPHHAHVKLLFYLYETPFAAMNNLATVSHFAISRCQTCTPH